MTTPKAALGLVFALLLLGALASAGALWGPRTSVSTDGYCELQALEAWPQRRVALDHRARTLEARRLLQTGCPGGLGRAHLMSLSNDRLWRPPAPQEAAPLMTGYLEPVREEWQLLCQASQNSPEVHSGARSALGDYDRCELERLGIFTRDELNPSLQPSSNWSLFLRLTQRGLSREAARLLTRDLGLRDVVRANWALDDQELDALPRSSARHFYSLEDGSEHLVEVKEHRRQLPSGHPLRVTLRLSVTTKGVQLDIFAPGSASVDAVLDAVQAEFPGAKRLVGSAGVDADLDAVQAEYPWAGAKRLVMGVVTSTGRQTQPLGLIRVDPRQLRPWLDKPTPTSRTWQDLADALESHSQGCIDWRSWSDVIAGGSEHWSEVEPCDFGEL
ncbi:MAG: hypothetical protein R3B09_08870 [Nannocystaceae bacterium]